MGIMLRKILGAVTALGLIGAASVAGAVPIFDGTVSYLEGTTCQTPGVSYPAIYRPQIGASASKSGLVLSLYRSGVGFTLPVDGQFDGNGAFGAVYVTSEATVIERTGTFSAEQIPALVKANTQTIILTATFDPSGNGCTFKFKGVFVRRAGT
jgi:hypothetical protein